MHTKLPLPGLLLPFQSFLSSHCCAAAAGAAASLAHSLSKTSYNELSVFLPKFGFRGRTMPSWAPCRTVADSCQMLKTQLSEGLAPLLFLAALSHRALRECHEVTITS